MKDYSLDFGQLIAYFVPGYMSLRALAYFHKECADVVRIKGGDFGPVLALLVFSLSAGMVLSVLRGATLDRTFRMDVGGYAKNALVALRLGRFAFHVPPRWSIKTEKPLLDYAALRVPANREVFTFATAELKRPYQFYGNTLLAMVFYAVARVIDAATGPETWHTPAVTVLVVLVSSILLYGPAREAQWRFGELIKTLGVIEPQSSSEP